MCKFFHYRQHVTSEYIMTPEDICGLVENELLTMSCMLLGNVYLILG